MNNEDVRELWATYLNDSFKHSIEYPPYLFGQPKCGTCIHWHLIDKDTLDAIEVYSPKEYEQICRGMEGKIIKAFEEDGQIADTYNTHVFYGFCKRFPPASLESDSTTRSGLFSRVNCKTPKVLAGYRFPFLPHEEQCGEWKQSEWAREELSKNKR